ncbi:hypothetical protein AB6A40_011857, partial [Gnathostoma spinigerum]
MDIGLYLLLFIDNATETGRQGNKSKLQTLPTFDPRGVQISPPHRANNFTWFSPLSRKIAKQNARETSDQ